MNEIFHCHVWSWGRQGSRPWQDCFRAHAQLLRQKSTRVPYRSSSLTQVLGQGVRNARDVIPLCE